MLTLITAASFYLHFYLLKFNSHRIFQAPDYGHAVLLAAHLGASENCGRPDWRWRKVWPPSDDLVHFESHDARDEFSDDSKDNKDLQSHASGL